MIPEQIFKALGDGTRLRMIALLMSRELCVCQIMDCLDLSQSNASRHLTILKNAGVLTGRKQAQWAYYRISGDFPEELRMYLSRMFADFSVYEGDQRRLKNCRVAETCGYKITEKKSRQIQTKKPGCLKN